MLFNSEILHQQHLIPWLSQACSHIIFCFPLHFFFFSIQSTVIKGLMEFSSLYLHEKEKKETAAYCQHTKGK